MTWYNAERVAEKGSVILNTWRAEREAARSPVENSTQTYTTSSGTKGSQLYEWLTGAGSLSTAGPAVTERTAMAVSAVYSSIGLIAGSVSSMPIPVYERSSTGRKSVDHPLWWLFNEQPTPAFSAAVFWEYLIWSLLLHGDAFARIHRGIGLGAAQISRIEPLHPLDVTPLRNGDRIAYRILLIEGGTITIDQDDMLHIPGLGFDGLRGLSPLRYAAKSSIGLSLAADEYSSRFFSNGARPDYVVSVAGSMTPAQAEIFRESWMARYGGLGNAHIPAILSGGGDVKALSLNPEDAQLIQTRNYQASDIARFYGVPGHMIGIHEKTSSWGTGIEQMSIGFIKYTLQRHLVKIEQEINRKCFRTAKNFVEFNFSGLERGDYKTRNEGYRIAAGRAGEPGWMTINEIRRLENLPPIEGGDDLFVPAATSAPNPSQTGASA